jgi:AraC-like DNA-binding protein
VRVTGGADEVRVLPDGRADVVWRQGDRTTLVGPETRAQLISYSDSEVLVGIRFRPGAAGPVMGVPLHEVRDLRVDVMEVDPAFNVEADLASLALDAGYADQAHLTREATRLAGATPLELVRSRSRS